MAGVAFPGDCTNPFDGRIDPTHDGCAQQFAALYGTALPEHCITESDGRIDPTGDGCCRPFAAIYGAGTGTAGGHEPAGFCHAAKPIIDATDPESLRAALQGTARSQQALRQLCREVRTTLGLTERDVSCNVASGND